MTGRPGREFLATRGLIGQQNLYIMAQNVQRKKEERGKRIF